MIHRETSIPPAAVLTGMIISSKDLTPRQPDMRARLAHLMLKTNHRGSRQRQGNRVQIAAAVRHHGSLAAQDEHDGPSRGADVDGLEVCVEDQDGLVHEAR